MGACETTGSPGWVLGIRDGAALTDRIIDQREVAGTVVDRLRELDALVRVNVARGTAVGGPSRVERVEYPEEAIRQLVRNAVIHSSSNRRLRRGVAWRVTWVTRV